jgi:hypothetical protein
MFSKTANFLKSSASIHTNLMNLRSLNRYGVRSFTVATPEPKILHETLSHDVHEIKLNAPKNLNSLDFEMVHDMIKRVKLY